MGITSGTTTLTIWDETDRPVTFLVRVTIDTRDLEARIRQAFPGADVKVRQVGPQIILDGQVPDSKTMSDVLQVVSMTLMMTSPMFRGGGGGGAGGGRRRHGRRWRRHGRRWAAAGWAAVAWVAAAMGGGGGRGRHVIVNRVTVPGPRQVLLHVKIAEINRSATRDVGVSWLYARGKSIFGSAIGGNAHLRDDRPRTSARPSGRGDSPGRSRGAWPGPARPRPPATRRSSASSTRGTSRCSSTPCGSTAWRRSSPSRT